METQDLYDLFIDVMDVFFDFYNNIDDIETKEALIYFNKIKKYFISKNSKILLNKIAEQQHIKTTEQQFIMEMENTMNDIKKNFEIITNNRKIKRKDDLKSYINNRFKNLSYNKKDDFIIKEESENQMFNNNNDLIPVNININEIFGDEPKKKHVFILKTDSSIKRDDIINKLKSHNEKYNDKFLVKENIENSTLKNYYFYINTKQAVIFPFKNYKELEIKPKDIKRNEKRKFVLKKGDLIKI